MGIDASVIFDIKVSRDELLELACKLSSIDLTLKNIFPYDEYSEESWEIEIFDTDEETETAISCCWPLGLSVLDNGYITLWNLSRWKFVLNDLGGHKSRYFESAKIIAQAIGAKRIIFLSDYLHEEIEDVEPKMNFDETLTYLVSWFR